MEKIYVGIPYQVYEVQVHCRYTTEVNNARQRIDIEPTNSSLYGPPSVLVETHAFFSLLRTATKFDQSEHEKNYASVKSSAGDPTFNSYLRAQLRIISANKDS